MASARRKENWLLAGPLYLLTAVFALAGSLVAYWLVHEWMGYYGGKSVVFYIAGMVAGGYVVWPLWWLYRRRYPKTDPIKQE